ncbi:MAG: DUF2914 domain-containing protein [Myxococcota bacterium]
MKRMMMGVGIAAAIVCSTPLSAQDSGLEVTEVILSKALENGRPVDPGASFSRRDGRIYCTVRVTNPSRTATTIRVAWERAGGPASSTGIELNIPARPRYRTVARTGTGRAAGRYRCVVYDADDRELGAAEYELTE